MNKNNLKIVTNIIINMEKVKYLNSLKSDGILFLQGVFKKDCQKIEEMFRNKIISETNTGNNNSDTKIYDKIPVIFTNLNDWPKYTNIPCWYCMRNYKGIPWFMPQSIEPTGDDLIEKKKKLEYKNIDDAMIIAQNNTANQKTYKYKNFIVGVKGLFCCRNCVRAFINLHISNLIEKLNKIEMLKFISEIFTGEKVPDIQPSLSPYEMIKFGGKYTELEYQQKIESLDGAYVKELEDNNFNSICKNHTTTSLASYD